MNKFSTLMVMFLTLTLTFVFAGDTGVLKKPGDMPVRQAFMEKSPGAFNGAEYMQKQQETVDWLMGEAASLAPGSIISIPVSAEDLNGIENFECDSCGGGASTRKVRIGVVKPAGIDVTFDQMKRRSFSRVSSHNSGAVMRPAPDGGFVWTIALESPTASAMRVHFNNFSLDSNAEVYIYNLDGEAFGPYTGSGPGDSGEFWSHTVSGSMVFVQLRYFEEPSPEALKATHFVIADIGYLGEKFLLPFMRQLDEFAGDISRVMEHCPDNAACVEDASCYSGTAVNDAKYAVAYMEWVSGAWIYSCTGGLIADTDTGSQIPYFLTANHCMSKSKPAQGLECYFQYWTASCGAACNDPVGGVYRTLGADILVSNRSSDYTLLQLWENPPSGSAFMGWTTADVANTNGTQLFRISHPSGVPQAYSKHVVDTGAGTCSSLPMGNFIYSRDVIGATEGGSSGSPLYTLSGQIVGQLYGACGTNLNEVCDFENNATVDGAFASYYTAVAPWLDNGSSGGGGEMHVHSITLSIKQKGSKGDAMATVTIVDDGGNPVAGADVTGTFTGDASGTTSGTTDASGEVTLKISYTGTVSSFTFCVDNVTLTDYTYDSAANVETCDTY